MIQNYTYMDVADNSGAKQVMCFHVLRWNETAVWVARRYCGRGCQGGDPSGGVKKGDVSRAVIVRTTKEVRREDGSYIKFDRNACVLINAQRRACWNAYFRPVARELRWKKFMKIISLAPEVL